MRLGKPNQGRSSHFPHSFWSSYEYLSHYQSEQFPTHYKWSYRPPLFMLSIES
jgi:hypothetical protein